MYAIYHVDNYTKYLLYLAENEPAAVNWVLKVYNGRFMPGRDHVQIVDSTGKLYMEYEVDYMPQFEAKKSWPFKSKSSKTGKVYETRLTMQDMLSCNCPAWVFKKAGKHRSCKHILEVVQREGYNVEVKGQYLWLANKVVAKAKAALVRTPEVVFAGLIAAYEKAIDYMASLDPDLMLSAVPAVEEAKFKVECYMLKLEGLGINGQEQFGAAQAKLKQALQ